MAYLSILSSNELRLLLYIGLGGKKRPCISKKSRSNPVTHLPLQPLLQGVSKQNFKHPSVTSCPLKPMFYILFQSPVTSIASNKEPPKVHKHWIICSASNLTFGQVTRAQVFIPSPIATIFQAEEPSNGIQP